MGLCSSSAHSGNRYETSGSSDPSTERSGRGAAKGPDESRIRDVEDAIAALCCDDGHNCVFGGDSGSVGLLGSDRRVVRRWEGHEKPTTCVCASGGLVGSGSRDRTVCVWSDKGAECVHRLEAHTLTVSGVAFVDGLRLVSGSRDTSVRVWDVDRGEEVGQVHRPRNIVTCVCSYGPLIAQGSEDLQVRLWRERGGDLEAVGSCGGYTYFPVSGDLASDGVLLATGSKGFDRNGSEVRIWDLRSTTKGPLDVLHGHSMDTTGVAFNASNTTLASASKDGTVRLWTTNEGKWTEQNKISLPTSGGCTDIQWIDNHTIYVSTNEEGIHILNI